jgi:hypothetical protein
MHTVGNDPYWIQLGHTWRARLDLHLVLANMRVLFGLVTTWPNYAGDDAAESVLAITHQGTTTDCQGATIDCQGAATRFPRCHHRPSGCRWSYNTKAEKALPMRCVDHGGHRSQRTDLHACPTVGTNCHGLWQWFGVIARSTERW